MTEAKSNANSISGPMAETHRATRSSLWYFLAGLTILLVGFLTFYNLTSYPVTWFDEGSHLHVPKTLIRFGVYADYRWPAPADGRPHFQEKPHGAESKHAFFAP